MGGWVGVGFRLFPAVSGLFQASLGLPSSSTLPTLPGIFRQFSCHGWLSPGLSFYFPILYFFSTLQPRAFRPFTATSGLPKKNWSQLSLMAPCSVFFSSSLSPTPPSTVGIASLTDEMLFCLSGCCISC